MFPEGRSDQLNHRPCEVRDGENRDMALALSSRKVTGDSGKNSLSGVVEMGAQLGLRRKYQVFH